MAKKAINVARLTVKLDGETRTKITLRKNQVKQKRRNLQRVVVKKLSRHGVKFNDFRWIDGVLCYRKLDDQPVAGVPHVVAITTEERVVEMVAALFFGDGRKMARPEIANAVAA